jgi:hypothetical protein
MPPHHPPVLMIPDLAPAPRRRRAVPPLTGSQRLDLREPTQAAGLQEALALHQTWLHSDDPRSADEIAEAIYRIGVRTALDSLQPETAIDSGLDPDDLDLDL